MANAVAFRSPAAGLAVTASPALSDSSKTPTAAPRLVPIAAVSRHAVSIRDSIVEDSLHRTSEKLPGSPDSSKNWKILACIIIFLTLCTISRRC